jgi:hypothetical protein
MQRLPLHRTLRSKRSDTRHHTVLKTVPVPPLDNMKGLYAVVAALGLVKSVTAQQKLKISEFSLLVSTASSLGFVPLRRRKG